MGVDTLKTVQYSATGLDFALGQAPNPASPWPKFINKSYSRTIDFEAPASSVARVRVQGENPPHGGGQQPIVGEQAQNQTIIVKADTPWAQQLEIWMMPHGFLRAAALRHGTVEARTIGGKKYNVLTFVGDNKAKVNGYINAQNLVERVETLVDNPFLGDMPFEAIYSDYKDAGGVQFPMHIVQKQGGYPVFDLTIGDVTRVSAVREARRRRLSDYRRLRRDCDRLQGLHRARRERAERGPRAGGHRGSETPDSGEADQIPDQHA
jgi:hypothetical protein